MSHYRNEIKIAAPASAVYRAITTPEGLQGWWTATCNVGAEVGAQSTFRFGQTHNVMQIVGLQPNVEVRWRCVEQHHHAPDQLSLADEWTGTSIVFRLASESPKSTVLQFEHIGLLPTMECFEICNAGWNHFLDSLKRFVETGKGAPYVEHAA